LTTKSKDKTAQNPGQSADTAAERTRVLRSVGAVAAITLLSRIAGYGRDIVATAFFGTGLYADAFVAAFRLPNILRRLVGEGNVAAAFVPVFEHEVAERPEEELWGLADSFHLAIAATASLLTFLGILAAPWLVRTLLIPGNPEAWEITTRLVWITFPYLIFISSAAALMAILNARDKFAAAAFTPVLYNLTMIASVIIMLRVETPIYVWGAAAVAGGAMQWLSLVPHARRLGLRFRPGVALRDPALRRIGALMIPGLFGVGITQVNVMVGQYLASFLALGSISSLFFAARLTELPLGVFAVAIATVVLPVMSRQAARGLRGEMLSTLNFALRQVVFITLPASVGLVLLRREVVAVLFERGAFDERSTAATAAALAAYCLGLVGIAGVRVVAPGFFALRDTLTPVITAAVAMVVHLAACLLLIPYLGHAGIALASSLAAYVNLLLLLGLLRRRVGLLGGRRLAKSVLRLAAAAAVMGWVVWGLKSRWFPTLQAGLAVRAAALGSIIAIGALTYAAAAALLRAPELHELRQIRSGRRT
jgi:putative peptidoglycan lipid II flippase